MADTYDTHVARQQALQDLRDRMTEDAIRSQQGTALEQDRYQSTQDAYRSGDYSQGRYRPFNPKR